jgi:hypothetical protein
MEAIMISVTRSDPLTIVHSDDRTREESPLDSGPSVNMLEST